MTLAHRLVVLNGGRIEQVGTPLEVYRRPASTFVAAFIGSPAMNLLDATADAGAARLGSARIAIDGIDGHAGRLTVGIRPEDLQPAAAGTDGALALKVAYVEELGAQRLVHGTVEGQTFVCALPSDGEIPQVVTLTALPGAVHAFDAASGKRLN